MPLAVTLVYLPGPIQAGETAEAAVLIDDLSGNAVPTNVPRGRYGRIRAAPDGERIALDSDVQGEAIIWVHDLAGSGTLQRVTFEGRNQFPVWSPDGERIAFQSTRGGDYGRLGATRRWHRSGAAAHDPERRARRTFPKTGRLMASFLSVAIERDGLYSLALLSLRDGTLTSTQCRAASVDPPSSSFSSDGRWIAYHVLPPDANPISPSGGVFVEPVLPNGALFQAPKVARDFQPVWSPEGADLYYIPSAASDQIARVPVATERGLSFGTQTLLPFDVGAQRLSGQTRAFDVLPDGRFIGARRPMRRCVSRKCTSSSTGSRSSSASCRPNEIHAA